MAESEVATDSFPPAGSSTEARMNRESINRDSIKKGFNDFKRFAGTNFGRAKQVSIKSCFEGCKVSAAVFV